MDGCIALVDVDAFGRQRLALYVKNASGYHQMVASLDLTDEDLKRWKALSIEEAYAFPEGFLTVACNSQRMDVEIIDAEARDENAILITLTDNVTTFQAVMEVLHPDLRDAHIGEILEYEEGANASVEMNPLGERALMSGGLPIINSLDPVCK